MITRPSLIATLSTPPSLDGEELIALPAVDFVSLPAAAAPHTRPDSLRQRFGCDVLYEFNVDCDLDSALLRDIPAEARVIAWYGEASSVAQLQRQLEEMSSVPARFYKLVNTARNIREEFLPLHFLQSLARDDVIAYATGGLGFWTRIVALQLGAPAICGLVSPGPDAAEPAIAKLIDDYGLPELRPVEEIFAIIGDPIFHSLSPRLHNASYRAMNYP
ncbi:MAG TPA: type I 3-dehydroquinate dehydratase, partial [Pyrinomonadaceae bacterium]